MSVYYNVANTSAVFKDSFDPDQYELRIQKSDDELVLTAFQHDKDQTRRVEIMLDKDDFGALLGILMRMNND